MKEKIHMVITNPHNNKSKTIDITDYSVDDFNKTGKAYSKNFDVQVKRYAS